MGDLIFETGQFPSGVESISTSFSSLLPFQMERDDWNLFNSENAVPQNWKAIEFDDSTWTVTGAGEMGNHRNVTAYIRHEVYIPSLEDYHVLNIQIKYAGGVAAYFNGHLVARFNLDEVFTADTEAITLHNSTYSRFHIILPTVGAVVGKNMMAFEIHRAPTQSNIVFDATSVFGVNDCSPILDSFLDTNCGSMTACVVLDLLDLNPSIFDFLPNTVGSFLSWTVENLEGSKWNSFALQTSVDAMNVGFSMRTRWNENEEELITAMTQTGQSTMDRSRVAWSMPAGMAGFKQFRLEINSVASSEVRTNVLLMQYCKATSTTSCPAVDDYDGVAEGEISPSKCSYGFYGYTYRECVNGQLGEVKTDKCNYKVPWGLEYANSTMEFVKNTEVSTGIPSYENLITQFSILGNVPLPEGLTINSTTGEISGVPVGTMNATTFTVKGANPSGDVLAEITISVREGRCLADGVFEQTLVDGIAIAKCSLQGSYVGTLKRACILDRRDGKWQEVSGRCIPVVVVIIGIVLGITFVVVIVYVLFSRATKKSSDYKRRGKRKLPITKPNPQRNELSVTVLEANATEDEVSVADTTTTEVEMATDAK